MPKIITCIFVIILTSILFIASQLWLVHIYNEDDDLHFKDIKVPVILWWTPFVGDKDRLKTCGKVNCYFTENRIFLSHDFHSGILFYGSSFKIEDLPLPRQANVDWGLLHEESPRNVPMFTSEPALALFNYSATFSRHSDVPLTLVDLDGEEALIGTKYFVPLDEKNRLIKETQIAPLLYIQSDCSTASNRDSYVKELMKYIPIDSYGTCLNNKHLPDRLTHNHPDSLRNSEFLSLAAQYKFTLAFENAVCEDYITEKLWRTLVLGSVPVYYGSPSFKDWLPNKKSAISVRDFAGPKELANFLLTLAKSDSRYQEYITHKISTDPDKRVTNTFLLNDLRSRAKGVPNEFGNYVDKFECLLCQRAHDKMRKQISHVVTKEHYNCPIPVSPLTNKINKTNWWVDEWIVGKCKAKLLAQLVLRNTSIDQRVFDEQVSKLDPGKDC